MSFPLLFLKEKNIFLDFQDINKNIFVMLSSQKSICLFKKKCIFLMLVWKAIFTRRKDSIKIKMYVFQVFKHLKNIYN
jgi:hypothetical protein